MHVDTIVFESNMVAAEVGLHPYVFIRVAYV